MSNKNLNFQTKNELLRNMYIIKKEKKEKKKKKKRKSFHMPISTCIDLFLFPTFSY